jgi:hypothetical protein
MEKINRAWYCLGDEDRKQRCDSVEHLLNSVLVVIAV